MIIFQKQKQGTRFRAQTLPLSKKDRLMIHLMMIVAVAVANQGKINQAEILTRVLQAIEPLYFLLKKLLLRLAAGRLN